jgi:peptidoglycan hydrolase CwlO-like protein
MEFNLSKFLVEHKLTKRSLLNEDDNTGGMMKTDAEKEEMGDEEMFDPTSVDPYGGEYNVGRYGITPDTGDIPEKDYDKEPTAANIKTDRTTKNLHTKQEKLQSLEHKKDALLMQLKSGQLGLDQYKAAIGNIPAEIKKLRADIQAALGVDGDEEEPEV